MHADISVERNGTERNGTGNGTERNVLEMEQFGMEWKNSLEWNGLDRRVWCGI